MKKEKHTQSRYADEIIFKTPTLPHFFCWEFFLADIEERGGDGHIETQVLAALSIFRVCMFACRFGIQK